MNLISINAFGGVTDIDVDKICFLSRRDQTVEGKNHYIVHIGFIGNDMELDFGTNTSGLNKAREIYEEIDGIMKSKLKTF
ncbi:hypothetical protein CL614_00200 [archaeon]|nr:hypothetical protein [archaeon]